MPNRPNPAGWKGGSEDFEFTRTFEGHLGTNPNYGGDPGQTADEDSRRNSHRGTELCNDYLPDEMDIP